MYQLKKVGSIRFFKDFDYQLLVAVLVLSGLGLVVLSSATLNIPSGGSMMLKESAGLLIGIIAAIIISVLDYNDIKIFMSAYYAVTMTLLVLVLFIGIGKDEWGSSSWIDLGFISFQPSEFAKVAFIFTVAVYLERYDQDIKNYKNLWKLLGFSILPILLIILEPDAGTAMVYVFIFAVILFIYGLKYRYILSALVVLIVTSPLVYFFLLKDYQRSRILALLFPGSDSQGTTYQIDNALMAIGSGGLFGKGLYKGMITQSGAVPVRESDFIFTVIGEELGFVGAMIFIVLIIFIIYRAIMISRNASDRTGMYISAGIAAMYAFQFSVNIGMNLGLFPISGLPLPFVSYAGTAMIANYICIGFLFSISLRRKQALFSSGVN